MAEIGHAIVETNSIDTTTSTSFTHVGSAGEHEIQGSSLDGSSEYILLAHALHGGSSTSNNQIYMNVTENGVGALGNSEQRAESRRNGGASGVHYGFLDKITTASTPNDYEIQMKSNGSDSSNVTGSWLAMIKLDDLTTDQCKYAEVDTDDTSISTSTETGASVTLGEGDWLIFAFTRWDMNSNSDAVEFQIDVDGNNKAFTRFEARDTTEVSCMITMTAYTVSGDSVTAAVEYSSEGTNPDLLNSRIFAIDMNAFQDHAFKQKAKGVSTTSIDNHDTNYTVDTLTHTSNTGSARDWAIFSHLTWDVASTQARMMNAIDQGGTQIIGETNASANSAPEQGQHDGADECALLLWGQKSSHAHNTDLDLDLVVMDNDSPGNGGVDENTIAAFTWELASPPKTGSGSADGLLPTITGVGEREVTGTSTLDSIISTVSGVGEREITATSTLNSLISTVSGVGERTVKGTDATVEANPGAVSGVGEREIKAVGSASVSIGQVAGVGERTIVSVGSATAASAAITAAGKRVIKGAASVDGVIPTIAATGIITKPGTFATGVFSHVIYSRIKDAPITKSVTVQGL